MIRQCAGCGTTFKVLERSRYCKDCAGIPVSPLVDVFAGEIYRKGADCAGVLVPTNVRRLTVEMEVKK